ncbi:MAG: M20/M25/M40 family metallo-hydrolase [Bacteroidales bacterium]|nr:M20/M25/M40 family metallo-hydrolase [Bacteroidales bacterium]
MKRKANILLLGMALLSICIVPLRAQQTASSERQQRLERHVFYMAADSLNGRGGGSEDANKVAHYIEGQFKEIGVEPFFEDYLWEFTPGFGGKFYNVVGIIKGSDPALCDEYIVVGAHYDHLGVRNGKVYNGADDNASGTATVIELARTLVQQKALLRRSVIIVTFDGEEMGLLGSKALCDELASQGLTERCKLMFSIDMVGWLDKGGPLKLVGTAMLDDCDKILKATAKHVPMEIDVVTRRFDSWGLGSTDSEPFARHGVPALYVSTGLKSPYHKPEDDAWLINYEGLNRVTEYLSLAVLNFSREDKLEATGRVSIKHRDEPPFIEFGLSAAAGSSHFAFPSAGFTGRKSFAFAGGADLHFNYKHFTLATGAEYTMLQGRLPVEADPFNSTLRYRQQAVTLPAMLQYHIPSKPSANFYIGVGAYFSHVFDHQYRELDNASAYSIEQNQHGLQWCIGMRMYHYTVEALWRYSADGVFLNDATHVAPNARLNSAMLRLGILL